jgi:hypothetical protein
VRKTTDRHKRPTTLDELDQPCGGLVLQDATARKDNRPIALLSNVEPSVLSLPSLDGGVVKHIEIAAGVIQHTRLNLVPMHLADQA